MKLEWETINKREFGTTKRLRVIGGWIVKDEEWLNDQCQAMVFVPDPGHKWGEDPMLRAI